MHPACHGDVRGRTGGRGDHRADRLARRLGPAGQGDGLGPRSLPMGRGITRRPALTEHRAWAVATCDGDDVGFAAHWGQDYPDRHREPGTKYVPPTEGPSSTSSACCCARTCPRVRGGSGTARGLRGPETAGEAGEAGGLSRGGYESPAQGRTAPKGPKDTGGALRSLPTLYCRRGRCRDVHAVRACWPGWTPRLRTGHRRDRHDDGRRDGKRDNSRRGGHGGRGGLRERRRPCRERPLPAVLGARAHRSEPDRRARP